MRELKVYCNDCKYRIAPTGGGTSSYCRESIKFFDTPMERSHDFRKCIDVNAHNDCQDWEKKPKWKFWA